jgi:SHS2 domain-containing protein
MRFLTIHDLNDFNDLMQKYKFIDHTGDLGIQIFGEDLPELFKHAGEAFFHIITDRKKIRKSMSRKITVNAEGLEDLLVNWLNEFVFLFDTEMLLFRDFEISSLDERHLEATVHGEPYNEGRHPIKTTVKGATYHQLGVYREKDIWKAQVIFDL